MHQHSQHDDVAGRLTRSKRVDPIRLHTMNEEADEPHGIVGVHRSSLRRVNPLELVSAILASGRVAPKCETLARDRRSARSCADWRSVSVLLGATASTPIVAATSHSAQARMDPTVSCDRTRTDSTDGGATTPMRMRRRRDSGR